MHRVYVAWDAAEAKRFLQLLEGHGIHGRIIEDREFPARGELHDVEGAPEVWISDEKLVPRALELAAGFEPRKPPPPPDDPD